MVLLKSACTIITKQKIHKYICTTVYSGGPALGFSCFLLVTDCQRERLAGAACALVKKCKLDECNPPNGLERGIDRIQKGDWKNIAGGGGIPLCFTGLDWMELLRQFFLP